MMEEELDRPVACAEVYLLTHTKKDKHPVDDVASRIQEQFKERASDISPYLGQKGLRIPDDLLHEANMQFVDCVGGEKNGRISGLGNLSSEYLSGSTKCSALSVVLKEHVLQLSDENSKLREEISDVRESLDAERQRSEASQAAMQKELARLSQLVTRFLSNSNA